MLKLPMKRLFTVGGCLLLGAMLSQGRVFGFPIPFAAILPLILPPIFGTAVSLGALITGALTLPFDVIPLGAALGAALLTRIRLKSLSSPRTMLTASALVSGVYLMSSLALAAFSGGGAGELFRAICFSAILLAATCACLKAAALIRSAKAVPASVSAICLLCAVCAFSGCGTGGVSVGGTVAAYAVLFAAVRFGPSVSAAAAMISAFGAGLCYAADFRSFSILGIAAVVCGFAAFGSPIRAAGCLLAVVSPMAVLFGADDRSLAVLLDCAAASVIFVLTYRHVAALYSEIAADVPKTAKGFGTERLKSSLYDISSRLGGMSENVPIIRSISDAVYKNVCLMCESTEGCPQGAISKLDTLPRDADPSELYRALPYCKSIPKIRALTFETRKRGEYVGRINHEQGEKTRLLSDILLAVNGVITDAEKVALRSNGADKLLTLRLEKSLKRSGFKPISCEVLTDGRAEIALSVSSRINEVKLCAALSDITGADYRKPERSTVGEVIILHFTPKTCFAAEVGSCQLSAKKDASGDVVEAFFSGSFFYTIISDGMGIGSGARAVSLMLVNVIKELITSGFSVSTAINLGSVILRASVPEETFATLDLLKVDLRNGAAELYKAGGCQSFLLCDGVGSVIRAGGYPVGILSSCDVKVQRFYVHGSATLVMMTDGAQNLDPEKVFSAVGSDVIQPSSELAALLLGQSEPEKSRQMDDVSVSVVKIERKQV